MKTSFGESEQGDETAEGNALLHRVAVELAKLGMLAEVGGLGVIPDERTNGGAGEVGSGFTSLDSAERGVAGAGFRKVGEMRVVGLDEF